jgi:hypothetical protein
LDLYCWFGAGGVLCNGVIIVFFFIYRVKACLLSVLLVFFVDHDFWMLECLVSSLVVQLGITKLFLVGFKLLLPGCFLVFSDYLLSFC